MGQKQWLCGVTEEVSCFRDRGFLGQCGCFMGGNGRSFVGWWGWINVAVVEALCGIRKASWCRSGGIMGQQQMLCGAEWRLNGAVAEVA